MIHTIHTAADLLEACRQPSPAVLLDLEHWEPTLPRIRWETGREDWDWNEKYPGRWVAECWWRSRESGFLGYYAKRDLTTMQLREFRELSPEMQMPTVCRPKEEQEYLQMALECIHSRNPDRELSAKLDALWESIAAEDTRKIGAAPRPPFFLVSREAVEQWDWERLRDLILKREHTTVEELRAYINRRYDRDDGEGAAYDRQ